MRSSFIGTLMDLAQNNPNIMLLTGDLGYSVLEQFRDKYPNQFFNVGIAEQNMAGIAAGLAMEGHVVFIYSIGNFPTLRCMEQIRYDICYHNLSVKIIAVGAGYAYGPLGTSHHTTEDLGMLRAIPNLTVCAPGDPLEVVASTKFLFRTHGPGYMRINKAGEREVHKNSLELTGGDILPIRAGTHTAVLTTGAILDYVDRFIEQEKKNWALYSVPFLNDVNPDVFKKIAQEYDRIITMEEHQLNTGFGSMIVERLSDLYAIGKISEMPRVHRVGIPNIFVSVAGTQEFLRSKALLTLDRF